MVQLVLTVRAKVRRTQCFVKLKRPSAQQTVEGHFCTLRSDLSFLTLPHSCSLLNSDPFLVTLQSLTAGILRGFLFILFHLSSLQHTSRSRQGQQAEVISSVLQADHST